MERIIIGTLSALLIYSSAYVWKSNMFTKIQKTLLLICIIFPPAQWLGILIVLVYNNYKLENTPEKLNEKKITEKKIFSMWTTNYKFPRWINVIRNLVVK